MMTLLIGSFQWKKAGKPSREEYHPRFKNGSKWRNCQMRIPSLTWVKKIHSGEQCRHPLCKQRGTHTNHRHKDCRIKNGEQQSPKHPNLGKAPTKSKDYKSKRDSSSQARLFPTTTANNDRRCYICNDPNHLSPSCPQKDKNKKHA